MPASGRFWIDETRGTVLRTEIEYDLETEKRKHTPDAWERASCRPSTAARSRSACFVPDTMTELYNFRGLGRIDAVARYSNYRRFEVSVGTAAVLPMTFGAEAVDPGRTEPLPLGGLRRHQSPTSRRQRPPARPGRRRRTSRW